MSNRVENFDNIPRSRLKGKIAIVTASTDGIGFAIARRLAQEGAEVVISSRKQENVDSAVSKLTSEGLKARGVVCHVSKAEDRKRFLDEADKLGGIDILVSTAGTNPAPGGVLTCDENAWDKILELNLKASFLLVKEAIPLIKKRSGGGRIIFLSSVSGLQPTQTIGAYSVSKSALISLSKVLSLELATDNITVNCVAPGLIRTKFIGPILNNDTAREIAFTKIAMKRLGFAEEVSGVVAFLASEDASYITGETICPSGGMPSRL